MQGVAGEVGEVSLSGSLGGRTVKIIPYAILVHGINVWRPGNTVGKLLSFFTARGYDAETYTYGWTGVFGAVAKNRRLAERLAHKVRAAIKAGRSNITLVGHSNGCAIIYMALEHLQGDIPSEVNLSLSFINPALDADSSFARLTTANVHKLNVYYNEGDKPVMLARLLRYATFGILKDILPWGAMGNKGWDSYKRMNNYGGVIINHVNTGEDFDDEYLGHSTVFRNMEVFGERIVDDSFEYHRSWPCFGVTVD